MSTILRIFVLALLAPTAIYFVIRALEDLIDGNWNEKFAGVFQFGVLASVAMYVIRTELYGMHHADWVVGGAVYLGISVLAISLFRLTSPLEVATPLLAVVGYVMIHYSTPPIGAMVPLGWVVMTLGALFTLSLLIRFQALPARTGRPAGRVSG